MTRDPLGLERELAVIKVRRTGTGRAEALQVSEISRTKEIDITEAGLVLKFIDLMRPRGLVELSRTGVLPISQWET